MPYRMNTGQTAPVCLSHRVAPAFAEFRRFHLASGCSMQHECDMDFPHASPHTGGFGQAYR